MRETRQKAETAAVDTAEGLADEQEEGVAFVVDAVVVLALEGGDVARAIGMVEGLAALYPTLGEPIVRPDERLLGVAERPRRADHRDAALGALAGCVR